MTSCHTEPVPISAQSRQLAGLAGLFADSTRAEFCLALLDGRSWTANELAAHAGVVPSTASAHLTRLIAGGALVEQRQGRHRYVQIAGHHVAQLIEDMCAVQGPVTEKPRTLRAATTSEALGRARTCYDHLAGQLGVTVTNAMICSGLVDDAHGLTVTDAGLTWLTTALTIDPADIRSARRPLVRGCLDWTERRTHLAGLIGALIYRHFTDQRWIKRRNDGRALHVTPAGRVALRELLGIDWT